MSWHFAEVLPTWESATLVPDAAPEPIKRMTSQLAKTEYESYRGGQSAALWLTARLWLGVVASLLALRAALDSDHLGLIVPACALVFVAIGWSQASLNNGFHEAVHENVGAPHRDWLSLLLLGFPTFFTLQYRTVHLRHHLKVGDPLEDPDFATYGSFPRSRWQLISRLIFMGSGLAAAKQLWTRNLRSGAAVTGKSDGESKRMPARTAWGPGTHPARLSRIVRSRSRRLDLCRLLDSAVRHDRQTRQVHSSLLRARFAGPPLRAEDDYRARLANGHTGHVRFPLSR